MIFVKFNLVYDLFRIEVQKPACSEEELAESQDTL